MIICSKIGRPIPNSTANEMAIAAMSAQKKDSKTRIPSLLSNKKGERIQRRQQTSDPQRPSKQNLECHRGANHFLDVAAYDGELRHHPQHQRDALTVLISAHIMHSLIIP